MFGHRLVSWKRHAIAVIIASFASSTVQTVLALAVALSSLSAGGMSSGQYLVAAAIVAPMLWSALILLVTVEFAIGLTVAKVILTAARQNFGAAYMAFGLLIGVIEAIISGALKNGVSPRDFFFGSATGALGGLVYWMIASRNRATSAQANEIGAPAVIRQNIA